MRLLKINGVYTLKKYLFFLFLVSYSAWSDVIPNAPHIYVEGYAEQRVKPEIIVISAYLRHTDKDASVAKSEVDRRSVELFEVVKKMGIAQEDIRATPLRIAPHNEYKNGEEINLGTRVVRSIDITLRDLSLYNELNQSLVDAGVSETLDAEVKVENPREIKKQVLFEALKNARQKAEQLAELNDKKIKDVYSISEFKTRDESVYDLIPSQEIYGQSSSELAGVSVRFRAPPPQSGLFEIGEMTASATVYVVFTIQ